MIRNNMTGLIWTIKGRSIQVIDIATSEIEGPGTSLYTGKMSQFLTHLAVLVVCIVVSHGLTLCSGNDVQACSDVNAGCVNNQCTCNEGFVGDPFIACFPEGCATCSLLNDPRGFTFAGQPSVIGIDVPVPCRYLAAKFRTNSRNTKCNVEVFAAEQRYKGKFYVSGFEVILKFQNIKPTKPNQSTRGEFAFRASASLFQDELSYELETKKNLDRDYRSSNDLSKLDLEGDSVFSYDENEKRIQLLLPGCGVAIYFRPADFAYQLDQKARPGLIIGVDQNGQTVRYNVRAESFCMSADPEEYDVSDVVETYQLDADEAFTFRALANSVEQNFPNTSVTECSRVSRVMSERCTDVDKRATAMQMCYFILSEPKFVNCYSGDEKEDSGELLDLFRRCIRAYCLERAAPCRRTQQLIAEKECSHLANPNLVGFNCDFNPHPY